MKANEDQIPLQEIVYKPTVQNSTQTPLKPESSKKSNLFLFFAVGIANLIAFCTGIAFGWPSPVLPKLEHLEGNPLGRLVTTTEASWIAGLPSLGGLIGPIICGPTADKIGRKKALLLFSIPMTVSFIIAAFANTVLLFYISRLLVGIGLASTFTVLPLYLAEISEDHNRGTIGCTLGISLSLGFLFAFSVGPFTSIRTFCLLCAFPLIIFFIVFAIWIPEAPHFLASSNKNDELEKSLSKLRNSSFSVIQKDIQEILKSVYEEKQNQSGILDIIKFRGLRRALIIILGIIILQQFAGINAVLCYMQKIFDDAGGGLAPETSTIIVGFIQTLSCVTTSYLADRLGRRIMLMFSALVSCLSLVTLGLYFHLKTSNIDVTSISWLPISSLIVYIIAFNIGLGPLPWAVMAELFPSNVKSVASTITSIVCFFCAFIITFFYPGVALILGMAKSFWLFALVCLGGTVFIYVILPETKGKSLQEIQRILEGKN